MTRSRTAREGGITLLELMIAMAIIIVVTGGVMVTIGATRNQDLRTDTGRVRAAFRTAYDRAATTGKRHRVIFDLEAQSLQVQRCEGKMLLKRADDHATQEETAAGDGAADGSCAPIKGKAGRQVKLHTGAKVKIDKVWVSHLDGAAEKGQVAVYFFPPGYAERAVVEVTNTDKTYTVLLQPGTGHAEIVDGEYLGAEQYLDEDAEGKKAEH